MIDQAGRAALAEHRRRLASGRLTNVEFDSVRLDHSADEALVAIGDAGWSLYDDFFVYRLRGRRALSLRLSWHSLDAYYSWTAIFHTSGHVAVRRSRASS